MISVANPEAESKRPVRLQPSQPGLMRQRLVTTAEASFFLATRLAFGLLCLVTSVYCLLLSIPFSYHGFIHDPIVSWLPAFVRLNPYLYGIALCAVAVTLIPDLRNARTRASTAAFLLVNAALSFYFILFSALRHLGPDLSAYTWSLVGLFPVVWLGAIDAASAGVSAAERRLTFAVRQSPDLASLAFSAVSVACGFAAASMIRNIEGSGQPLSHQAR
jgi:hypothetical protein